jgi:asparagine synthase (glutamine-hydrolysing)
MCGIAGIIDLLGRPVDPAQLLAMNRAIAHRGPDDEGYALIAPQEDRTARYSGASSNSAAAAALKDIRSATPQAGFSIGFAHRRFSIIDLSSAGHQPFVTPDNRWSIIYNGEIYNYRELRNELAAAGVTFVSDTDTEVVLHAYRKWGAGCFNRFNGFWALAIYDADRRCVALSRDRIGVKPLYYRFHNDRLVFASEIKSLLALPGIGDAVAVEKQTAHDWLEYGLKNLSCRTFFSGIDAFPAASWAFVRSGFPSDVRRYWSLPRERKTAAEIPAGKAAAELEQLLTDAISLRLRADVPLAVSLSGGIDSSALAALAKHNLGVALPAFTVSFPDSSANEEPFARQVAASCGCEHTVIAPSGGSLWHDIGGFTRLQEEPYHLPNLHTDQQVWAHMRKCGIKVALNGAGGDENFGGYGFHYSLMQLRRIRRLDGAGYVRAALECKDSAGAVISLVKPVAYALREYSRRSRGRSLTLHDRLIQDMTSTLMPYWLASGDRTTMGLPMEIREPFLDYRIVEFAFTLPLEYLVRDGWQKWIVRKAVEKHLPADVVWRKRKMGFPFPTKRFLRESGKIIGTIIESSSCPEIKKYPRTRWQSNWKMVSYLLWYERFIAKNETLFAAIVAMAGPGDGWMWTPEYLKDEG